jgi:hypothetical protein
MAKPLIAAIIGAMVACGWMFLAGAALGYGVPLSTPWNLAVYISCPMIRVLRLNFWPVVLGNAALYLGCTWLVCALTTRKRATAKTTKRD